MFTSQEESNNAKSMVVATSWYTHKIDRRHLVPLGPAERAFDIHCEPCADHVIDNTLIIITFKTLIERSAELIFVK